MKTHYLIFALFLSLTLLVSCMDDSEEFQKFEYNPEDYPDPSVESPYHVEDYHILKQDLNLPQIPFTYTLSLPQYMVDVGIHEAELSDNQATLGRVLFYDNSLSRNETISCATCHKQELAFSDNQKLSKGIRGRETQRNSMPLGSTVSMAAYHSYGDRGGRAFLWDFKAINVREVSTMALTNPLEMDMTMKEVLERVKSKSYYPTLFKAAFGDEEITEERMISGFESFVMGMGSYESKFDEAMVAAQGDMEATFSSFTESENRGKDLYFQDCGICHGFKLVHPLPYGNNGLELEYKDPGIDNFFTPDGNWISGQSFKMPGLRNIALTAPYMHDGRFETLREVVDFYSTHIQDHPDLSEVLRDDNGNPVQFNYTDQEKTDLVAFLETLTDHEFTSYEKYSNPFK